MLQKRIPAFQEVVPVYSVIATILYLWTLFNWLWQLPSWLLSLTLGESISILVYEMVNSLVESVTFLVFLLGLTAILPQQFLKNDFIVRATWLSIGLLGSMAFFFIFYYNIGGMVAKNQTTWTVAAILASALLAYFSGRTTWMRNSAFWISDRLTIFLYFFLPLSVLCIPIVLTRNIF